MNPWQELENEKQIREAMEREDRNSPKKTKISPIVTSVQVKFNLVFLLKIWISQDTVGGSEIRRSPVEGTVELFFPLFREGFSTIPGGDRRIFEPSTDSPGFLLVLNLQVEELKAQLAKVDPSMMRPAPGHKNAIAEYNLVCSIGKYI